MYKKFRMSGGKNNYLFKTRHTVPGDVWKNSALYFLLLKSVLFISVTTLSTRWDTRNRFSQNVFLYCRFSYIISGTSLVERGGSFLRSHHFCCGTLCSSDVNIKITVVM